MTTRGAMITEMQSDMGRTNAAATLAMQNKIGAAVRYYQNNRFWFNEGQSAVLSTVIGTNSYSYTTVGTEFYKVDSVMVTTANADPAELDFLDPVQLQALLNENPTDTGQPFNWSFYNQAFWFYPSPDNIYAIEILGHIKIAAPVDDTTDGNVWMGNAYDLIMCHAKAELYAHRWEDPANAAIMAKAESMWLTSMQDETADKMRSGFVQATDF
jgi:hypothetical protein